MTQMLSGVWALLLGIVLIMPGNGMHFTLIGLRGGIEEFTAAELAVVTSGYFVGFLSGARSLGVSLKEYSAHHLPCAPLRNHSWTKASLRCASRDTTKG